MSIKVNDLEYAIQEAKRFINWAEVLQNMIEPRHGSYAACGVGNKYTGAVKRASMDLTRALVHVRSTK